MNNGTAGQYRDIQIRGINPSNGNVGIGTITPTSTLFVQGAAGTNPLTIASSTGTQLVTVTQAGNVGIGTSTPTLGPLTMGSGAYVTVGGAWTNASDRRLKENFATMSPASILEKIVQLSVMQWNYKYEGPTVTHIGPVAQEFWEAFHVGNASTSISTIDPAGVALLGIQALDQKIQVLQGSLTANATATNLSVYNPGNFSGDSVGEAKILSGQTSVRVTFTKPYTHQPIVTITLKGVPTAVFSRANNVDSSGFMIQTLTAVTSDTIFAWHSFASSAARLTVSDGSTQPIELVVMTTAAETDPDYVAAHQIRQSSPAVQAIASSNTPTLLGTTTPASSSVPATSTPSQTPTENSTTTSSSPVGSAAAPTPAEPAPTLVSPSPSTNPASTGATAPSPATTPPATAPGATPATTASPAPNPTPSAH